jgi:threonine synthase
MPETSGPNYISTMGFDGGRSFADVVIEGAAPDGGLYVPETLPFYDAPDGGAQHAAFVAAALEAFGASEIDDLVETAFSSFNHPDIAPIREVGPFLVLEMFWGPTLSFKDHALQILGPLVDRYLKDLGERRTVVVATSGDTGSAAIEGFRGLESVDIVVLFPKGLITDFQRRQMTTISDDNVTVVSVEGSFDDCQRMVKEAFAIAPALAAANSINWGRIAAQTGYHMSSAARIGEVYSVVIPTGNFGNAYSAHIARLLGAPIQQITVANNANKVLHDLHQTGRIGTDAPVATFAPAMDIQVPSNLERYLNFHEASTFGRDFSAGWASDELILETIRKVYETYGYLIDPHTATAWSVAEKMGAANGPLVVVSTAHPAKFARAIELATGIVPDVPEWGVIDPDLKERTLSIGPTVEELLELLPT